RGTELRQLPRLALGQRALQARRSETDRRQVPEHVAELDRHVFLRASRSGRGTRERHPDYLSEALTLLRPAREAECERRRVRLERRVGPVALILHLELVAFELEADRAAAAEVDLELRERREERCRQAVDDLLRANQRRQATVRPLAARTRAIRPPRHLGGMEDAPADAVVIEVDVRLALERAREGAVG